MPAAWTRQLALEVDARERVSLPLHFEAAARIDLEVKRLIDEAYERAKKDLTTYSDKLKLLATTLLEKEVLDAEEVRALVGIEKAAL